MFFGINKEDLNPARWRIALPYFLIFWLGSLAILLLFVWLVRTGLHAIEIRDTERLVNTFLKENSLFEIYREDTGSQKAPHLGGLAFVRLVHGQDHLIRIQEIDKSRLAFQDLVNLSTAKSGVWIFLKNNADEDALTIISRRLTEDILLQAGKNAQVTLSIYRQLIKVALISAVSSFFLIWLLTLLWVKRSLLPLKCLQEKLSATLLGKAVTVLPRYTHIPELTTLFKQIDQLDLRNRNLMMEMQASLDNVAHDLRTPMTRLRSVAEYGLQAVDEPERLREALSDCLEESERVLAMLKIMMSVAEAESGTMRLELRPCNVEESLRDIVELYTYVAEEKNIEIKMSLQPGLQIMVDQTRISQVWGNLLDNAIKYGREGGLIEIRSASNDGILQIDFVDNGMGISQNEIERIWERLYRGDRSRTQQGLGLGLNYVRAVIHAHGGNVGVKSTLHQGSCFSVYLPIT